MAGLHCVERLGSGLLFAATAAERGLGGALRGDGGLQRGFQPRAVGLQRGGGRGQRLPAQCQQPGLQLALSGAQRPVLLGGTRLPGQHLQAALEFLAHVGEAVEVLARVADAGFGLAPAFLVLRDAGGLFEEGTQFLGPGVDDARDHALLDDRVAARPEAGAEEQLGHVAPPAARAVQEVLAGAVAVDEAAHRDLGVARPGAAEAAFGVVEHQFDAGLADGLARRRTAEDHVAHRLAAQARGRRLAHHPAHGVDDVGLAAAVRAEDADEVRTQVDRDGIDEGLESGEAYPGQAHGGQGYPRRRTGGIAVVRMQHARRGRKGRRKLRIQTVMQADRCAADPERCCVRRGPVPRRVRRRCDLRRQAAAGMAVSPRCLRPRP